MKDKVYTYKGNHYVVTEDDYELKNPVTGIWEPAVIYKNNNGKGFVRTKESFISKYKLVTNE
jgi:hypothetical protein